MTDTIRPRPGAARRPDTAEDSAVWYAAALGWPVTPGRAAGEAHCPRAAAGPGPWQWAASSAPALVRAVWRLCPGAPVLAVLGRAVPGARRLGVVDVPSLVGVAALERLAKNPAAAGPVADGHGRIRFLVDLGDGDEAEGDCLAHWRAAGVDLHVYGCGRYCPLPTPGVAGPDKVVWAVPPDPQRPELPHARQVTAVLDRAVRDAYPAMWNVVTHGP
jgi:hypothetical protein